MRFRIVTKNYLFRSRLAVLVATLRRAGHEFVEGDADVYIVDTREDFTVYPPQKVIFGSLNDSTDFLLANIPTDYLKHSLFMKISWNKEWNYPFSEQQSLTLPPYLYEVDLKPEHKLRTVTFTGGFSGIPMPRLLTVKIEPGDYLRSLLGFRWEEVYNAEYNQNFRSKFPDPSLVRPGEILLAPANPRVEACLRLKNESYFVGGMVEPDEQNYYQTATYLTRRAAPVMIPALPRERYLEMLARSKSSLCLPGTSLLTFRHFESMHLLSNVVSPDLSQIRWLDVLEPGKHYFVLNNDLSNLEDVCERSLREDKTQAALRIYQQYYMLAPDGGMNPNMWLDVKIRFRECGLNL
jgi:hypothetical protein